ncbi:MAG: hypothetical protein HC916_18840 [Coleofasciculaceae cyanobacterium SM2_1_6]|nr:hypothetical protein [Coleofasciculaceae cyanobacterium SM2_1_6]
MPTYQEILDQAQTLTPDEQQRLLKDLATLVHHQEATKEPESPQKISKLNLKRWRGFLPKRVDALEFQIKLRQEWDES